MFARPWVRWLTVLVPVAWTIVEVRSGTYGWAALFAGIAAYAFWILVVKGPGKAGG